jgi:RNA polymerase sigma factor (sigma-70 family)
MIEDAELLRRYASERSEAAFAELVRRRVNLVYSVALRQVGGDAHLAEDVTQKVFVDLARKADALAQRPVISGWLCRSAQFAGRDAVRTERRRRAREQESQAMQDPVWSPVEEADWNKVRPLLDEVLGELNELERDAIALRFFENRPFAEIGARLRLTDEAARKRVDRALDRMAAALSRHGVTSTTAALGLALSTHAGIAAPAGLASSVTTASLAAGAAAASSAGVGTWLGFTSMVKIGLGAVSLITVVATGVAWREVRVRRATDAMLIATQRQQGELRAQVRTLQTQLEAEQRRAQAAEEDNARLLAAIEHAKNAGNLAPDAGRDGSAREMVETRYKRAQDLARDGKWEQALAEMLWCYDEGMVRESSFSGTRLSVLLADIAKLGRDYPPALAALRERREAAQRRLLASAADETAAHEFLRLNAALGDESRTLEVYDRLAADDPRRRRLVLAGAFQLLVDARRYHDALQAVPYERMVPWFEREAQPPDVAREMYPEMALKRHRRILVGDAAKSVEVLAGAGDLARARQFAEKILAFDGSAETRELLQKHAARAGQPTLLATIPSR